MTRDFTIVVYKNLLQSLLSSGYCIQSYLEYIQDPAQKAVILRHDVDKNPYNALKLALLENKIGIHATYYFRIVSVSYSEIIIKKIAGLGHEIGYHYEDLSLAKGNIILAKKLFEKHLSTFRELYPVKTICMHGSPISKWDNRILWKNIDYRQYDILSEPYFDLDFNEMFYLTDTGRGWNASNKSIRDKVKSKYDYYFKSTHDLIKRSNDKNFPPKIMINVHPQRWDNNLVNWTIEYINQNIKNLIKGLIIKQSDNNEY